MVVCIRNGRQDSLYQPVGGTAGISGLTAAIQRTNNEQCSRPQSDCVDNSYQNLRFSQMSIYFAYTNLLVMCPINEIFVFIIYTCSNLFQSQSNLKKGLPSLLQPSENNSTIPHNVAILAITMY